MALMGANYNSAYAVGTKQLEQHDSVQREQSIQERIQAIVEQLTMAHGALDAIESVAEKPLNAPSADGLLSGTAFAWELAEALRDRIQTLQQRIGRL